MEQLQQQIEGASGLDDLYPALASSRMTAGWHKKRPSLWKEPRTEFRPLHWRYELGKAALDQAGRWIGTELAERRNLLLFNPVGDNDYATLRTMVVAYQMIKSGEYARAHEHTPNALRLILDAGPGCYTVVDGVKLPMRTGDVLITPGGCYHSHFNEGDANAYWIDVLDVPLVHALEPMLFSELPGKTQEVREAPEDHAFYFPPAKTEPLLAEMAAKGGVKTLKLPTQPHIRTLDISLIDLQAGASRRVVRSTASRVLAVVHGSGTMRMGDVDVRWSTGDVLAVPNWCAHEIVAEEPSRFLEVCDEPTMRALGFYREAST